MTDFRVGYGYDIHRLIDGDYILLATVKVKADKKIDAHSDGDILLHALSQAILSSLGKEDIGFYFPDDTSKTKDMSSLDILNLALKFLKEENYVINNVVIDIILEKPKLKDYKVEIKEKVCSLLNVDKSSIAINCNTHEKVDSVGENKAIETVVVLTIRKE